MKKHTLLLACAMRILLNLIALRLGGGGPRRGGRGRPLQAADARAAGIIASCYCLYAVRYPSFSRLPLNPYLSLIVRWQGNWIRREAGAT